MEKDDIISVRVPKSMRKALERERQFMSKAAGAEIKESALIRSAVARFLLDAARRRGRGTSARNRGRAA